MLSQTSLKAAYPLAEILAAKGFQLLPVNETPLAELIGASTRYLEVAAHAPYQADALNPSQLLDNGPEFTKSLLESAASADPMGVCEHDQLMEKILEAAGAAVQLNLDVARNKVNPLIKQVISETEDAVASHSRDVLTPIEIVPFFYKAIWDSSQLADLVAKYQGTQPMPVTLVGLAEQPANLLEAMSTGSAFIDELISQLYTDLGESYVGDVWANVFGPSPVADFNAYLNGRYAEANRAMVVYFLAGRLKEAIPEGLNMPLEDYRSYISIVQAQAGRVIANNLTARQGDIKIKRMVISIPSANQEGFRSGVIVVLGDVYNAWLQAGGTPEALMGAVVLSGETNYTLIIERKSVYEKEWQRTVSLLQSTANSQRLASTIGGMRQSMTGIINAMSEDTLFVDRAILHTRLAEQLSTIIAKDMDNLWCLTRRVVCRVLFPQMDVEQILEAIDTASKAHPELDIRESAFLATVDYVSYWVFRQMTVQKVEV